MSTTAVSLKRARDGLAGQELQERSAKKSKLEIRPALAEKMPEFTPTNTLSLSGKISAVPLLKSQISQQMEQTCNNANATAEKCTKVMQASTQQKAQESSLNNEQDAEICSMAAQPLLEHDPTTAFKIIENAFGLQHNNSTLKAILHFQCAHALYHMEFDKRLDFVIANLEAANKYNENVLELCASVTFFLATAYMLRKKDYTDLEQAIIYFKSCLKMEMSDDDTHLTYLNLAQAHREIYKMVLPKGVPAQMKELAAMIEGELEKNILSNIGLAEARSQNNLQKAQVLKEKGLFFWEIKGEVSFANLAFDQGVKLLESAQDEISLTNGKSLKHLRDQTLKNASDKLLQECAL